MRILILDDEQKLLVSLKGVLSESDFEVDCADAAENAVELVKNNRYDFILVDYKMPGKDGVWFMRNADIPRETKVLLITAYVNRDVINEMFSLGASGYLIKPFDEEELMHHLSFHADEEPEAQV